MSLFRVVTHEREWSLMLLLAVAPPVVIRNRKQTACNTGGSPTSELDFFL
jgi:hypothetical protein